MFSLIKKAKWIFLAVLAVYILSYAAGYIAGRQQWVNYQDLLKIKVAQLSRNLEKSVPVYGKLLEKYKELHNKFRDKFIKNRDIWGMRALIFLNNWIVANLTMIIRAIFILPVGLTIFGKFFQGVVFAQTPASFHIWLTFLTEFGGYFLTICATLSLVLFTIFYQGFRFVRRRAAFRGGLKLLGLALAISAVSMIIGSIIETDFIMKIYQNFQ